VRFVRSVSLYLEQFATHTLYSHYAMLTCRYCSNNLISTVTSLVDAIWADVLTVARLLAVCFGKFGLGGCVCQMAVS
jgi:hypothetical protein